MLNTQSIQFWNFRFADSTETYRIRGWSENNKQTKRKITTDTQNIRIKQTRQSGKHVSIGEIAMAKLCNRNTNRSFMARIQLLDGKSIVAAAAPPQFDKHLQLNNVHASRVTPDNYCELMTFDENETESQRTNCQLILCEHAIRDKMLSNRDQSGENSYVYFVQNPNQSNTTTIDRGPATRCGTNNNGGNTKSKLKQFFRGHSINVLILLIFSLGLVDMVNGESIKIHLICSFFSFSRI